jgi:hypothetical protein
VGRASATGCIALFAFLQHYNRTLLYMWSPVVTSGEQCNICAPDVTTEKQK